MLACLFIPLFPLAARLRSEPDLKGEAVAIFEGNGNAARVIAATRKARGKGLQPGMTLPQARSLFPKLLARARDPESERAAQEALLEIADTFSPKVEDASEGLVYLDLEGLPQLREVLTAPLPLPAGEGRGEGTPRAHPFSNPPHNSQLTTHNFSQSPAHALARDIISAAEKMSLPLKVGIAASKLAARVAAGLPDSPTVVPEGEEGQFLGPLPLSRLAPAIEIAEMLERWGIRSIGEFARLPEGEVASRLGELGRELHAAARGIDPRPLEPRLPPFDLSEGMDFEWPLVSLEPFLFLGNAALERLVQRLESQGLACVKLETTLKLDPDGCDARSIALPAPTREVKTLLTLVRLELEARPPGAPVSGFTFTAHPDKPRRAQLTLFGAAALSPDRLATTIARLAALLGASRVGSPRTVNGHRPERFAEVSFAPPPPPTIARSPRTGRGLLAVRVLRPPVELEVITAPPPLPRGGARGVSPRLTSASAVAEGHVSRSERPAGRGEGKTTATPVSCHPEERSDEGSAPLRPVSLKSVVPPSAAPAITNHQSQITNPSPSISGSIRVASGPWSLEDSWWSETPADRDYWDVELSDGALYRIYRDRKTGAWFADGLYD
jgi:protein ImuB